MKDAIVDGKQRFVVSIPSHDGETRFDLCECTTSASAAEVVRAVMDAKQSVPNNIMVEIRYAL